MNDKITIIEGPTPTFEVVSQEWVLGLSETPFQTNIALTRLRTFNGPALVERCHRAWRNQQAIQLEFRDEEGLEQAVPIVAARTTELDEGQMLLLWVRIREDEAELELDRDDDAEDDLDDDLGFKDL